MVKISDESIQRTFRASAALLLPDARRSIVTRRDRAEAPGAALAVEIGTAQWAFDQGQPAGFGTDTLPGSEVLYIPLRAPTKARGVLAVKAHNRRLLRIPEQRQLLDTFAALIAIALERVHYVGVAQDALLKMESERLRNSLLAALSHDLRTPLTVLVGLAESLTLTAPPLSSEQLETARSDSGRGAPHEHLVSNLLDMARIESGEVKLNLQWQPLEEVVGAALDAARGMLQRHHVEVRLPRDLPLVKFDAVLIERVLVNLLENVSKYTPPGSTVTLSAAGDRRSARASRSRTTGRACPSGRKRRYSKNSRAASANRPRRAWAWGWRFAAPSSKSHQGKIVAAQRPGGGAIFTFTLPLGNPPPPAIEPETAGRRWLSRCRSRFSSKTNAKSAASCAPRWRRGLERPRSRDDAAGSDRCRERASRISSFSISGCRTATAWNFCATCAAGRRCRSSCCRRASTSRTRSTALDAGADDYLTKPFGVGELLARVRATSRRRLEAGAERGCGVRVRRRQGRSEPAYRAEGRRRDSSDADRVSPAEPADRQCRQGADASADPARGVGTGALRGRPLRARLHGPFAAEARGRSGAAEAYPDRNGGRLSTGARSARP